MTRTKAVGFVFAALVALTAAIYIDEHVPESYDTVLNDAWVQENRNRMELHAAQPGAVVLENVHLATAVKKMKLMTAGDNDGHSDEDDNGQGNDNHYSGNELKQLGRKWLELQANNTRSIQGVLNMYATALEPGCHTYLQALRNGDSHVQELMETVVTPDVLGRIHPLGSFIGPVNLIEYFQLRCASGKGVDRLTVKAMVAYNDTVHYEFDFLLGTSNLTHIGWARVRPDGRVCRMKVTFQRLEINDKPLPAYQNRAASAAAEEATINGVCAQVMARCTGANQQFATQQACVDYQKSIPDGGFAKADQQDRGCIRLHSILTGIRPDVHCPHVGPTGGGKCTPHPQPGFYASDEALYAPCADV